MPPKKSVPKLEEADKKEPVKKERKPRKTKVAIIEEKREPPPVFAPINLVVAENQPAEILPEEVLEIETLEKGNDVKNPHQQENITLNVEDAEVDVDTETEDEDEDEDKSGDKDVEEQDADTEQEEADEIEPVIKSKPLVNDEIYTQSILWKSIVLSMDQVGGNLKDTLKHEISSMVEGKCIVEGYVKKNSVEILSHSCGVVRGNNIVFDVSYSCDIFLPCADMVLGQCIVTEVLESAGVEVKSNQSPNIFIAYVYQDHNFDDRDYNVKVGDVVTINIVDYRFEIYDEYITLMGEIV